MSQTPAPCKLCNRCQENSKILYRVQFAIDRAWVLVCPQCWQIVSLDNPYYLYGGTWKQRRK
jgi:hypothetical protein